jgi:Na+/H+ antiporter NhaD/arsenite permease-like protein
MLVGAIAVLVTGQISPLNALMSINIDVILFLFGMFIVGEALAESGYLSYLSFRFFKNVMSVVAVLFVSVLLSQLISNVPLVALYLPLLLTAGASSTELMALASGSTIAGNLFILGAASNVIIIQNAENKFGETITFLEFGRIGVILTAVNLPVYCLFLSLGS